VSFTPGATPVEPAVCLQFVPVFQFPETVL
jgi:hypothetical protein